MSGDRGFSLLEILIAILVSLFLTAGIIKVLLDTSNRGSEQKGGPSLQQVGQHAIETIAEDVRMVDYAGCTRLSYLSTAPNVHVAGLRLSAETSISGATAPAGGGGLDAWPGTDLIRLRLLSAVGASLHRDMAAPEAPIHARSTAPIRAEDLLAIADCTHLDVFSAASVTAAGDGRVAIQPTAPLSKTYLAGSRVLPLEEVTYLVATGPTGRPALQRISKNEELLAEGVHDMEILYGEDIDGDGSPDRYRSAAAVMQWSRVLSVRVSLLLISDGADAASPPRSISWHDGLPAPDDGRPWQTLTSAIALRNRLP